MNPAILNYLQSQQGQPQGQGEGSPMQQNQGQQVLYNPFDSGIRSAIESAKQSLGMTEKQQDKALRRSMLTFADNMAQQPKQRGFFNNFGAATRALSPAIAEHDQAEDEALTQNNAMANQILAYKAAEEKKLADAEYNDWYKKHAENQLEEQRMGRRETEAYRQQKLQNSLNFGAGNKAWEYQAQNNIKKIIPEITNKYESNERILPVIDEFKELLQNSKLTGASKVAEIKRFVARQTGQDEAILNAKNLGQFYLEWLKENTTGVLSDKDIAVYSAGFADIEKNPNAGVKVLERLKNKLLTDQQIYSRKLNEFERDPGANLSRINIINRNMNAPVKNKQTSLSQVNSNEQKPNSSIENDSQGFITMLSPKGVEWEVPANKQKLYEDNQYTIVK